MPYRSCRLAVALVCLLLAVPALAQDLEPRAFSPAPTGLNFAVVNYGYSTGNIFFDPALPIEGAAGTVHAATLGYVRTLSVFGASAKITGLIPYAWGHWDGVVDGIYRTRLEDGFADPIIRLSVNFIGAPAFTVRETGTYSEGTIVGASVAIVLPWGEYDPDRLINLGSNRRVVTPRLGVSHRVDSWTLETTVSASFFSDNSDAYQDTELAQAPLWGLTMSVVHQFQPRLWAGIGAGFGAGARTTIDGVPKDTYQRNVRLGATVAYPLTQRTSLKVLYLHSPKTERGADFDTISLAWQVSWGG